MKRLNEILNGKTENYIAPFLWLHNEDGELIKEELRRIHSAGIGAVCIESRTHAEFCRDDWWEDVRLILDTCRELGMGLWILDDKHFPSGYANGIYEREEMCHLRAECIRARRVDLAGPIKACSVLANEWLDLSDDELLAAFLCRRDEGGELSGECIDISASLSSGRYYFDLPRGTWCVIILIKTQADIQPNRRNYGNKLSPEATDAYIREVYEPHYQRFGDEFGKTLLGFFSDEPQFHNHYGSPTPVIGTGVRYAGYPWHASLIPELEARVEKGAWEMLLRLWYDFSDGSHIRFRELYMDVITKRASEAFGERIGKWCAERGAAYIGHVIEDNGAHRSTGYGLGHYFRAIAGQEMSGVDVVLHQLMPGLCEVASAGSVSYREMDNKLYHYVLGKLASSAAHIDEKKRGRAMCEIFGAFGWAEDTQFMKFLLDHFIVRGINYYVPHAFSPKKDDTDCPPNFYNTGRNPQFKYFGMLMSYINRICSLTNGASHVPTCAVIYDAEASWCGAEFTDNRDICKALYDAQLDYDLIPFDALDALDENGCINGEHYPVILLPNSEYYSEKNMERIARHTSRLLSVGGKVGACGAISLSALPDCMESYRDISVCGSNTKYVRYMHYRTGGEDFYLISNESMETERVTVRVKSFTGGSYVLFDAFENRAVCRTSEGGEIPITLNPNELLVLIPNCTAPGASTCLTAELPQPRRELFAEWRVFISPERELPRYTYYKTLTTLTDITGRGELESFTGNIKYSARVHLNPKENPVIDLGEVGTTAELYVNGIHVGTRIFAPYRFDISAAAREGENELEIIVTNTCVFSQRDKFSRFMAVRPSGVLGPVRG